MNPRSPLSDQPAVFVRSLPGDFLSREAESYFQTQVPPGIFTDYELWRCAETGLEFAWPALPGSPDYYQWLGSLPNYYPECRWEYPVVKGWLSANPSASIADVGGGDGAFATYLGDSFRSRLSIIDLSDSAVNKCRALGFTAICGDINGLVASGELAAGAFDVVTSFHCLEHVPDPVEFGRALCRLLKPGGTLYLSTPYSPMHFESHWFDIQNHPPHHLTRWNVASYQKLATLLGMDMEYRMPRASSWFSRSLRVFRICTQGLHSRVHKPVLIAKMLARPRLALSIISSQLARVRVRQAPAGDSILVMMRRPTGA